MAIHHSQTNHLLAGPLIIKTDGGPERLSQECSSIEFRDEIAAMGVHIILSLPNGTACTAEMDQLFEKFKPACSKSALRIAAKKIHARYDARQKFKKTGMDDDNSSADGDLDDDDEDAGGMLYQVINLVLYYTVIGVKVLLVYSILNSNT